MKKIKYFCIGFMIMFVAGCNPNANQSSNAKKESPSALTTEPAQVASQSSSAPAANTSTCSLSMGFDIWEPYQFIDIDRAVKGLDVEIINLVAEEMGCTLEYKQATWVELISQLKKGEVDLVLGASKTADREQFALFSDAYREEEFVLYIRNDEEHKYREADIQEFMAAKRKLGIVEEYYYGEAVDVLMESAESSNLFINAMMTEINIARLLDMDIDGFLEDSFVGASLIRRKGLERYIAPHQISIKTGSIYAMFSQKSVKPEMVSRFNEALSSIKQSGKFDKVINRYAF